MRLFSAGAELLGNVGWGVIKGSGKLIYGSGQAIIGMVAEDNELVEQGVKNVGSGAFGLTVGLVKNAIKGDGGDDEGEDFDVDTY
jgi:hypothetical protein